MAKKNEDLKIDINEIFGGDLPSPSEALDVPVTVSSPDIPASSAVVANDPQPVAEAEKNFQDWMAARNQELEMKALELERRLKELQAQQNPVEPSDSLSGQALQTAVVEEKEPPPPPPPQLVAPAADSPIDFDAPMAPPFMGATAPTADAGTLPAEGEAPIDPQKAEELKRLQAEHEFFMLYDEYRNIMAHELTDLVGEKKTNTMLERTVELARGKYPEVFRNANWDAAGNLLENGSIDSQRIIDNKNALDPQKADAVVDVALSALLNLRLQALEKGLGSGLKNKVRARMYQWINEKIQKAGKEGKDAGSLRRLSAYIV